MGIYAEVLEGGTLAPGMSIHIPGE
jgi:hypothetical protein